MAITPGDRIGPYEIVSGLGAGGMGEVYLARDARLDRQVAIKILRPAFAKDADRLRRFEREAKTLAALNHPHIAHIYGLESAGESYALVMEFVEGQTLAEMLHGSAAGLPLEEAVAIARQIAEAVEAAHEAGVIHRDLKPDNIKVRRDGTVKVLDFGLAKASIDRGEPGESSGPTFTSPGATAEGIVMGTPGYMSPEQARGRPVDTRTDVWAFGCVLYHMITGRTPFPGDTVTDIVAAVVRSEPDFSSVRAPARLRLLIERCLRKDPRQRLRDIGDARIELSEPLPVDEPAAAASVQRPLVRGLAWGWVAAAAVILLGAGAAGGAMWMRAQSPAPGQDWVGTRLGGPASVLNPRLSPDGQLLAFSTIVDDLTQVAVMKPDSGNWRVLTRDRAHGLIVTVSWSTDGSRIYYDRSAGPPGIYSVPALGGEERLVIESAVTPEPLADGSLALLKFNADRQPQLHRFWPSTGRLVALPAEVPSALAESQLRRLPDGRRLVFIGRPLTGQDHPPGLYEIDVESQQVRGFSSFPLPVSGRGISPSLAVSPDGSVVLSVRDGSTYRVFRAAAADQPARSLMILPAPIRIDAARGGEIFISLVRRPIEILRAAAASRGAERVASTPSLVPDGLAPLADGRLLVTSRAGDRSQVLVIGPGAEPTPLLETDEDTGWPMTPVGTREVALLIGKAPAPDIAIVAADTGRILRRFPAPHQLTSLAASPDGQTLYASAAGKISALPRSGGAARPLGDGDSVTVDPQSGDLIVKIDLRDRYTLMRIPAAGGNAQPIPYEGDFGLTVMPLMPAAVWNGQLALALSSVDSYNWHLGTLDLRTGKVTRHASDYVTDFWFVTRAAGNHALVGAGLGLDATLWKFSPARQ